MPIQPRTPLLLLLLVLTLLLAERAPLEAQPSDTITANPNAVKLRRIWTIVGKHEQASVGVGVGSVNDVSNDSIADIAYFLGQQWHVCYGAYPAPGTATNWMSRPEDSLTPQIPYPVAGDFWGSGQPGVVFSAASKAPNDYWFLLKAYRLDSTGHLPEQPTLSSPNGSYHCQKELLADDLDGDGADELILAFSCTANGVYITQTWIYKGGPAFQLDTPTVVVDDGELNQSSNYIMRIGDIDGDHKPDLVTGGWYGSAGVKLKFWLGATGSLLAGRNPDLIVPLTDSASDQFFSLLDVDNDGRADLLRGVGGSKFGNYLFTSSLGGAISERSLQVDSADRKWPQSNLRGHGSAGYLIDSTRRYEAARIYVTSPFNANSIMMMALGGGPNGPNSTYDAWYAPERDGLSPEYLFNTTTLIPDCNGDGWEDLFVGDSHYGGFNKGIALVLAGGPYIPRDNPNTSVEEIAVAGKERAISVWPNPARAELNIAWRGDLRPMPRRFAVHTLSGELVARGEVESHLGAAVWRCEGAPAGVYLLSVYGADGGVIATIRVVRE